MRLDLRRCCECDEQDLFVRRRTTKIGLITSEDDVIALVRDYVASHSSAHNLEWNSWKEIFDNRFGEGANVNLGGISSFLDAADACATLAGGCDGTASKFFKSFNQKLGLPADNGWLTFEQLMRFMEISKPSDTYLLTTSFAPSGPRDRIQPAKSGASSSTSAVTSTTPSASSTGTIVAVAGVGLGLWALAYFLL